MQKHQDAARPARGARCAQVYSSRPACVARCGQIWVRIHALSFTPPKRSQKKSLKSKCCLHTSLDRTEHCGMIISRRRQTFIPAGLRTQQSGAVLPHAYDLAYETWGTLDPQTATTLSLLCHGYTNHPHAGGDAIGWCHEFVGTPAKPSIPTNTFVVCSNMLGSAYGSIGAGIDQPGYRQTVWSRFPGVYDLGYD